jgi:hypothetical protein
MVASDKPRRTLGFRAPLGAARGARVLPFSDEQKAIFDAEMQSLRERMARRKEIMALPTKRQRDKDIDHLRETVERLRGAAASFIDGKAGFLSSETTEWLLEADAVARELATLAAPPRSEVFRRGMRRGAPFPAAHRVGYREWLIGLEIPALFAKVYGGAKLPVTIRGKNPKGKRGMEFVRVVLRELGENDAKNETIKNLIFKAKTRVIASKTPT